MYKQVVIARKDLNMSPGKLAAQVSHGSMAFLTWMIRNNVCAIPYAINPDGGYQARFTIDEDLFNEWIDGKFTKCVLQARNKNHLLKAKDMAEELGMKEGEDFFCIYDSCRTELEPEFVDENGVGRVLTCIGFKPFEESYIDNIGKKFHLYV